MSSSTALAKRRDADMSLMPPPPVKRTKRPATVLDEDEYTDALSDIIARDYFPGLAEVKAQEDYLSALESADNTWIREAGQKLKETMTPLPANSLRSVSKPTKTDNTRSWDERTPVPDTPRGERNIGDATPMTNTGSKEADEPGRKPELNTSNLSLTSFQSKYTSEDNESFNTLLDKQNDTSRKKHAYLWTPDQRIPSQHLLTHRANQTALTTARSTHEALAAKHNEQAVMPLTTGATTSRPASIQSWTSSTPNNTLMFEPEGIHETGLQTITEAKEAQSKAGPKETVFANTRFPPLHIISNTSPGPIPSSPSLNTEIIAAREAHTAPFDGSTPRVNGYSFVDEDEPDPVPDPKPSYRDLLAGQVGDSTPNPFKISETRRREDLHLRLVARDQARKREKGRETTQSVSGNMTPAARKLMERLGTPVRVSGKGDGREMWTPGATPRRKR